MIWSCKCFPRVSKMPALTNNRATSVIIKNAIIFNIRDLKRARSLAFSMNATQFGPRSCFPYYDMIIPNREGNIDSPPGDELNISVSHGNLLLYPVKISEHSFYPWWIQVKVFTNISGVNIELNKETIHPIRNKEVCLYFQFSLWKKILKIPKG